MKKLLMFFILVIFTVAFGFYAYKSTPKTEDYGTAVITHDKITNQWVFVDKTGNLSFVNNLLFAPDSLDLMQPQQMTYIKLKNNTHYDYCIGTYDNEEQLAKKIHRQNYKDVFWLLVALTLVFFYFVVLPKTEN